MTDKQIKIGDVVAWDKVPSGALVLVKSDYALRVGDMGHWVCLRGDIKMDWARAGAWGGWSFDDGEAVDEGPATIIALDIPANAMADDLRALAEVFEVREALTADRGVYCALVAHWLASMPADFAAATPAYVVPERHTPTEDELLFGSDLLHRAGWRPGMTAEDAARLLAGHVKALALDITCRMCSSDMMRCACVVPAQDESA